MRILHNISKRSQNHDEVVGPELKGGRRVADMTKISLSRDYMLGAVVHSQEGKQICDKLARSVLLCRTASKRHMPPLQLFDIAR